VAEPKDVGHWFVQGGFMSNKWTICVTALFMIVFLKPVPSYTNESDVPNDEMLIRESIENLYIKGLEIRDFELIKSICIPEALLMSVRPDDTFSVTSLDQWSKRFDPKNPPFKSLKYTVLKIDVSGTACQVQILFIVDGSRRVIDYLNLLKIKGKWRVVNIINN
jgi:hypothetical protein